MPITVHVDIVSAEGEIFSGLVQTVVASGALGQVGIQRGHAPMLLSLKPGPVRLVLQNNTEELFYISGGMLEAQPQRVTVLADTAVRAADLDEAAAVAAKDKAEKALADQNSDLDYTQAMAQLTQAMAQISMIRTLRKRSKS